jgi:hypothetical protein
MAARLTDQDRIWRSITEKTWQGTVERIAELHHWLVFHAPDNMPRQGRSGFQYVQNIRAGFPDLVLAKDGRLIFAELKRQTGTTSPDQNTWLDALRKADGVEVYLWRPSDLDQVRAVLGKGPRP